MTPYILDTDTLSLFSRLLAEHHPTTETQSCDHRT
jgi:hypothetical protein